MAGIIRHLRWRGTIRCGAYDSRHGHLAEIRDEVKLARSDYGANKRRREADKARKKREKSERRQRNKELRAQGIDPDLDEEVFSPQDLPEVPLSEISVSGVAKRPKKEERGGRGQARLFVGGLSWDTGVDDMRRVFNTVGEVIDAIIITDRDTGRSRGFGFVTYADSDHAQQAIDTLDDTELDGRRLRVRPATEN